MGCFIAISISASRGANLKIVNGSSDAVDTWNDFICKVGSMKLEERRAGKILVVKVAEPRLDAKLAGEFKEKIAAHIQQGDSLIVLDLAAVTFIDSSGLGAIVSSLKALRGQGQLALCGMAETVMSTFKLTRMDKVFRMFPGQAEAVAALAYKA
jgi:anti-sigma B factor antagonist